MMKRTLQLSAWLKKKVSWTFLMLLTISVGALQAQDNDSLCVDFSIVSLPTNTPPEVDVDSICYEWNVTNKTRDTLRNVVLTDPNIVLISPHILRSVPELLPFGQLAMSSSGMITGNSNTGSGSFMFTGSGCALMTDQNQIDQGFSPFSSSATADIGDMMGGVIPPMTPDGSGGFLNVGYSSAATGYACFGVTLTCVNYNISVNTKCETEVTPELLNIKTELPLDLVHIELQDRFGNALPNSPFVGIDDIGDSIMVIVSAPTCGNTVAECWSYANIEYKLGPEIVCSVDTISCAQNVAMNEPIVVDACGATSFIRLATVRTDMCKISSEYLAIDTITYAVSDQFGNVSDTCSQVRFIRKANLDTSLVNNGRIKFPEEKMLSCSDIEFDAEGNLAKELIGYPTLDSVSFEKLNKSSCNIYAEFEQFSDVALGCATTLGGLDRVTRRILGRWTIFEWKCEGGVTEIEGPLQVISFRDTVPPVIDGLPTSLVYNVDDFECVATFIAPTPTITDACNNRFLTLEYRYLNTIHTVDTLINELGREVKLPPGEHLLEYIARDACGNIAIDTVEVSVTDNSIPVAICLKTTTVTVENQTIYINADDIDQDSYDQCGIAKYEIRRGGTYCPSHAQDTLWGDKIAFCCNDLIENTVSVGLRVWDHNDNWNECWVDVIVEGGAVANVSCLPDTVYMSCDYRYDPADPASLEVFGIVELSNNPSVITPPAGMFLGISNGDTLLNGSVDDDCGVSVRELAPLVDIDSTCRTGFITRYIQVVGALNDTTICTQVIAIGGDQIKSPAVWTFVPANDTLTGMDDRTVRSIGEKSYKARAENNGCSMVGVGYQDTTYAIVGPSDYCAKVQRTWQMIDWCRSGAEIINDTVQYIYIVQDTTKPEITDNIPEVLRLQTDINVQLKDDVSTNIRSLDIRLTLSGVNTTTTLVKTQANASYSNDRASFTLVENEVPDGDYTYTWRVTDVCGNVSVQSGSVRIDSPPYEPESRSVEVVGQVLFADGGVMDQVEVHLTKEEGVYANDDMDITDTDGAYEFMEATEGASYYVDPRKNDDILNGVSTLDLLQIQRHVLGITPFTDAKDKIAADVNDDGKISAFDLVELRKVLLGKTTSFANNESWTFVFDGQNLDDIFLYGDDMMRRYYIPSLEGQMDIDFEGIKIGDVSGDAIGHSAGIAGGRSLAKVSLEYSIEQVGDKTYVSVIANEDMNVSGLQAELSWTNSLQIDRVENGELSIDTDQYHIIDGEQALRISNTERSALNVSKGDVLFSIVLDEAAAVEIALVESWMDAQVYTSEGVKGIQLEKAVSDTGILSVMQNNPNPWTTSTVIAVEIPVAGAAILRVYDVHSRVIMTESRNVVKGTTTFEIDNNKIQESGMYFYEVEIAGQRAYQKMLRVD